jgi:hypothetical protein
MGVTGEPRHPLAAPAKLFSTWPEGRIGLVLGMPGPPGFPMRGRMWPLHRAPAFCEVVLFVSLMTRTDARGLPTHHSRPRPRSPTSPTPIRSNSRTPTPRTCWPTSPPSPTRKRPVAAAAPDRHPGPDRRRRPGRGTVARRDRRMGRRGTPAGPGRAGFPPVRVHLHMSFGVRLDV